VSVQTKYRGEMWSDEAIFVFEVRYILWKEAIQLVFLLHSSQSPQQSEEKRNRI
jgi:hypothetical protein